MVTTRKRFLQMVLAGPLSLIAGLFRTRAAGAATDVVVHVTEGYTNDYRELD